MDTQVTKPKKSQGWMVLYIGLVIVGRQLAGIGGAIGGVFIAFGLNKVLRNPDYSKGKKVFYSILYSIGGIVMALAIGIALTLALQHYFPTIEKKSNVESTYQIPSNFTVYKNQNMEISSLVYPTGWTVTEGKKDEYEVNFQAPNKVANIMVNLTALEAGQSLDYKTYTSRIIEQAKTEPRISFEKTGEQIKNINGKDWLVYDSIVGVKSANTVYYTRTAMLNTDASGRQYFQILMESDKDHFAEDSAILDKVIESFRFYK